MPQQDGGARNDHRRVGAEADTDAVARRLRGEFAGDLAGGGRSAQLAAQSDRVLNLRKGKLTEQVNAR